MIVPPMGTEKPQSKQKENNQEREREKGELVNKKRWCIRDTGWIGQCMEQRGSSSGGEVWKGLARERKEKEKARKKEKGGRERER